MEWYWAVIVINLIDVIINGVNLVCLCWHCAGPWREDGLPAWRLPGGGGLPVLHGALPLQLSWRDGAESLDGWGEDQKQEFSTCCGHISCSFFILLIYFLLLLLLNEEGGRDGKHGIVDIVISHSGKNKIFCILHEAAGQASFYLFHLSQNVCSRRFTSWGFPAHQTSISATSWPSPQWCGTGTSRGCPMMASPPRTVSSSLEGPGGRWWWTHKVRPSSGSRTWRRQRLVRCLGWDGDCWFRCLWRDDRC